MKIYVLLAVIVPFSGLVSSTSLPNDPYLASDGRYGRAAAELAKVLVDFLASRELFFVTNNGNLLSYAL